MVHQKDLIFVYNRGKLNFWSCCWILHMKWQGHHVVFVGKMLYSHSASLHQGVYQMSTSEFNSGG